MSRQRTGLEVAVLGMAGRFPGAPNLERFWENLREGVESITRFSEEELIAQGVDPDLVRHPSYVKARPVLDGVDEFDARLFGFSPREAELLDPQHRLFLECVWQALEDAGRAGEPDASRTAVFAGSCLGTYLGHLVGDLSADDSAGRLQALLSNDKDYLASRVAYKMGLEGPAVTVQTACSTSLVAVHLASQCLLTGEADLAVAGGVTVRVPQRVGYLHAQGEIFSPDGHCRTFDAAADGTLFGSGVGAVVLKRLADAERDGDRIRAVLLGSAINNDGAGKVGFSAPRVETQARVIRAAQRMADVGAETIGYVEAHGTATPLGDPIEVEALRRAFGPAGGAGSCALGSVKSNLGHLETAAGIAGLVKAMLALEHGVIPPSLHFERPNPALRLDETPFRVADRLTAWPADDGPRRAGVSSFGIGGTNAHLVLEEAPARPASEPGRHWQLLRLSARSAGALDVSSERLAARLDGVSATELADVAHTLATGRRSLPHRRCVVCSSSADAVRGLTGPDAPSVVSGVAEQGERPVLFLFPGQGSQHPGMGRRLYDEEPVFRHWVDYAADRLTAELGLDLRRLLYPADGDRERAAVRLAETAIAQPVLFTVELALAQLWMDWGVEPRALVGHSVGEYVAACLAGVFGVDDGLRLIAERGRLMQSVPAGSMLAVHLPWGEMADRLPAELDLAAANGPSLSVVSGPADAVERLAADLDADGVEHRRLVTSHAFHSRAMEPILEPFGELVASVDLRPPELPVASNLTGGWLEPAAATDPATWVRQLREPVRFADCLERLFDEPAAILLEVGPSQTLTSLARRDPRRPEGVEVLASLPHAADGRDAAEHLLRTLGRLWCVGGEYRPERFFAPETRRRVAAPTYPFEHRRYWIEPTPARPASRGRSSRGGTAPHTGEATGGTGWLWAPCWYRLPWSDEPPTSTAADAEVWLVVTDPHGLGHAVARRLEETGRRAITVETGGELVIGDHHATVSGGDVEELVRLLDILEQYGQAPTAMVHAASVLPADSQAALEVGLFDVLPWIQALGRAAATGPVTLHVVSSGLHDVTGGETMSPESATLSGLLRVAGQEMERVTPRLVDLDPASRLDDPPSRERLARRLVAEMAGPPVELRSGWAAPVAFRGGHRWSVEMERLDDIRADAGQEARPLGVASGDTVLVTGGLGGLGLAFARRLAAAGVRLVLLGRTRLPERADWTGWLSVHGPDDPTSRRLTAVLDLEEAGADVMVASADVADPVALGRVVAAARERFGRLDGVIHAAGVAGGRLLQLEDRDGLERVLRPKLGGARALETVLADEPPAWWVLCASTIGLRGGVGQAAYAAANAGLDAFAPAHRRRYTTATIAIDWDGWDGVGLAAPARRRPVAPPDDVPAGRVAWVRRLDADRSWLLAEHRVLGRSVMPGTGWLDAAVETFAADGEPGRRVELRDLELRAPLAVDAGREVELRARRAPASEGDHLALEARPAGSAGAWTSHAQGRGWAAPAARPEARSIAELRGLHPRPIDTRRDDERGRLVEWGPRWSCLEEAWWDGASSGLAHLRLAPELAADLETSTLHPALVDVATSFLLGVLDRGAYLPLRYGAVRVHGPLPAEIWAHARLRRSAPGSGSVCLDVDLIAGDGRVLVEIDGFVLRRLEAGAQDDRSPAPVAIAGRSIDPAHGAELLVQIVARAPAVQVAVAAADPLTSPRLEAPEPEAGTRPGIRHDRPHLNVPFVAPRDQDESLLAEIWGEVLGIDRVGVDDNFFDLGGDSILGLQLLARAREAGLSLDGDELFRHQTVAELARSAADERRAEPEPRAQTTTAPASGGALELDDDEMDEILGQLGDD